jgi:hypothetical protein
MSSSRGVTLFWLGKIDRDVMKITEGEGFGAEGLEIEKPFKAID